VFIGFFVCDDRIFVCNDRMPKKGKKKPCLALTHGIRQGNLSLIKENISFIFFICQAQFQKIKRSLTT